jgi:hypothetical protein
MNESLPFGQPGMHTPWNYHGRPGLVSARHVQPQDLRSFQQHCGSDFARRSSFASGFDSETQPHPGFDSSMHTQSYIRPPHMSSQQGFREKVLLQAHRVYVDLLAYAQTIRKPQASKGAAGHNTSPRLLVYPKPPKPSLRISEAALGRDPTLFNNSSENDSYQDFQSRGHVVPYFQGPYNSYSSTGNSTLFAAAKSILDMLSSLCEQSTWSWIDGIMLGGCLHYGLDQYQEALEWFSRITALDSR